MKDSIDLDTIQRFARVKGRRGCWRIVQRTDDGWVWILKHDVQKPGRWGGRGAPGACRGQGDLEWDCVPEATVKVTDEREV